MSDVRSASIEDPSTAAAVEPAFEVFVERKPPGLLRRYLVTQRHFLGLLFGGLISWVRSQPPGHHGFWFQCLRVLSWLVRPLTSKRYVDEPFPRQLRKRLEALGPTYIKLGQILSLREDILPASVTDELKRLLNQLPALPFPRFVELIEAEIERPMDDVFAWIEEQPLGSASIGQTHRARTLEGDELVLKLVKPGIRQTIQRDVILLRILGRVLQIFLSRFQPKRVFDEFCDYTLREVDLLREADNAETFAANFSDERDIVFPHIYRELTTRNLLAMEFLDGLTPDSPEAQELSPEERSALTDLGAFGIIQMLYQDGFFHADLHPGNLIVLPGPKLRLHRSRHDRTLRRPAAPQRCSTTTTAW